MKKTVENRKNVERLPEFFSIRRPEIHEGILNSFRCKVIKAHVESASAGVMAVPRITDDFELIGEELLRVPEELAVESAEDPIFHHRMRIP